MSYSTTNNDASEIPKIKGLRMTKQRAEVYRVLMGHTDHPTANEVYDHARKNMDGISLATVYNCLEVLVDHGAVKQVNFDREPSRYCPNLVDHGHFHDQTTGVIHDVPLKPGVKLSDFLDLPAGCEIRDMEITLRGTLSHQISH
ncbi:Fur family transcriptional regulator [Persicirhabdus sediminis]|uniref:Transcriptional repressor n=1 Tax=Persicirhabdus sediminis TaxID=454144 RepID=A0A8J7SKY7_9BACT|nr:transcriptional repressor [Persicirhabdus sediminis]MBK1792419.1 transcriptional repressor [Persicirhabdus sediminis]